MSDEVENLINNIAGDMEAPGVDSIREIASARKQSRQRAAKVGGVAAIALVLAGLALWANRPQPVDLATGGETEAAETASAVADDSAPLEFEEWTGDASTLVGLPVDEAGALAEANSLVWRVIRIDGEHLIVNADLLPGRLNFIVQDGIVVAVDVEASEGLDPEPASVVQRRLIATQRWFAEIGQDTTEIVHFGDTQITFSGCDGGVSFDIGWTQDGFTVPGRAPADPNQVVVSEPCETSTGSLVNLAMPIGLDVVIEALNDGRIRLTSSEWDMALSATRPGDSDIQRSYVSLPIEQAGALAEANGLRWRVVHANGEELRRTDDLRPDRLNFTTQDDIVIHVRTDAELAAQNSPETTTTTTEPPETTTTTIGPGPCDQSLSFLGEIDDPAARGALPDSVLDIRDFTEITVLGRITAVEPGPTHAWVPERIEVDPDDPRAQVQVLHFTLDVDRAHPSSASVGQSVQFAFMFSPGTDHEVVEASWVTGCELVVFLFQGAVTNYDPDVWTTAFDGGAIGVVNGGRVEFPNAFEYIEALPIVEVDELFGTS